MPIRILENEKEGHRKVKTDFRKKRQQEYMKKHGKPDKKRIQIRPKVSDRMQKLRDNLASVTGGEWGKKSGGRIGLKEGGWPKGGPSKPRKIPQDIRDRLPKGTKDLRDRLKEITSRTRPGINERLGGGEKAKPHSTKEGRIASGKRKIKRLFSKEATRPRPGRPSPGRPQRPDPSSPWRRKERIMTPLRAKKGVGGILKKIITKIKPKPSGVFKPKPVPKAVTDVDRPFKGYDKSYTRADDKKITSMLKKLGDEIKAQPLPPKLKKTLKKLQQAYPHKKAKGGRIGLKGGSTAQSHYLQHGYGPHKIQLRSGKPKIAKKGW